MNFSAITDNIIDLQISFHNLEKVISKNSCFLRCYRLSTGTTVTDDSKELFKVKHSTPATIYLSIRGNIQEDPNLR